MTLTSAQDTSHAAADMTELCSGVSLIGALQAHLAGAQPPQAQGCTWAAANALSHSKSKEQLRIGIHGEAKSRNSLDTPSTMLDMCI